MISGYTASVRTPLPAVMQSTTSLSVALFISLPLRSATGSMKSNPTQHCRSFRMNNSSCSWLGTSEKKIYQNFLQKFLLEFNRFFSLVPQFPRGSNQRGIDQTNIATSKVMKHFQKSFQGVIVQNVHFIQNTRNRDKQFINSDHTI